MWEWEFGNEPEFGNGNVGMKAWVGKGNASNHVMAQWFQLLGTIQLNWCSPQLQRCCSANVPTPANVPMPAPQERRYWCVLPVLATKQLPLSIGKEDIHQSNSITSLTTPTSMPLATPTNNTQLLTIAVRRSTRLFIPANPSWKRESAEREVKLSHWTWREDTLCSSCSWLLMVGGKRDRSPTVCEIDLISAM